MDKLDELNSADESNALSLLEPLIERSPEIARKLLARRPFASVEDLCGAIESELRGLTPEQRVALFNAHPELAPDNPLAMTGESQSEQGRLELTSASNTSRQRLLDLNAGYRAKFGFPFITALVRHASIQSVLDEFESRLSADRDTEIERALQQVVFISASRVGLRFGADSDGAPA